MREVFSRCGRPQAIRSHAPGRVLAAAIAVLVCCAVGPATAMAECTVDQANIAPPTQNFAAVFSNQQFGQIFTVGRDGVLCAVAMYVDRRNSPSADLVLEVQGVSAGFPDGNALATAALSAASVVDGLNVFDISAAGLNVSAGDVYAVVLKSSATLGSDYLARAVPSNLYTPGQAVVKNGSVWALFGTAAQGFDAIFQTSVDSDVQDPAEQIADTIDLVESFGLPYGNSNSLVVKLNAAAAALGANDVAGACAKLTDFLAAVRAQRGKKLLTTQADQLTAAATQTMTALDCN